MRNPTRYCFLLFFLLLILPYQTSPQTHILTEQKAFDQFNPPVFEDITIKDGLPENSGTCFLQDYLGYLWLGTQNGLVQYDGYLMKVFQPDKDNSSSLSDGGITTIYEDKNKTLWIGTYEGGLNKFDRTNGTFKSYRHKPEDSTSINSDKIHCIYEDKSGRFWIGTFDGLNLFDRNNGTFIRYYFRTGDLRINDIYISKSNPYNLTIDAITEDPASGDLLIGTEIYGLWKFSIVEKIFSRYKFNSDGNLEKKVGIIQSFCKARDGKIWIASLNTLSSLDPQKKILKTYIDFPIIWDESWVRPNYTFADVIEDKNGLIWSGFCDGQQGVFCLSPTTGNLLQYNPYYINIFTLYEDRSGVFWIGTWGSGLKKLDRRKNQFQVLRSNLNNLSNSLGHPSVYSVIYDPKGFLWFCTQKALDKYDIKNDTYKHYLKDEECITNPLRKGSMNYRYIGIQDASGYIWLGTANCGLIRFDPRDESYRFYLNDTKESLNLVNKQIRSLLKDHLGILWIGTMGYGLYKYDIVNNKVTHYENDSNDTSSLSQNDVPLLFEDSFGTLWVGTLLGGLSKFDRKTEKFSHYGVGSKIYEDKHRNLWIEGGLSVHGGISVLSLFDREKGIITSNYSQKDGLAPGYILGILEDEHDNLWIGTEIGLSKFNKIKRTFRNYYKEDGLPDSFTESNCIKGPDGKMYFNTSAGELVFHPDSIKDDPIPPQVVLSGISLFNRPGEKLNYKGFISELKEITLPYDQNDLRFDFVGLHFSAPAKNRYKYILENFNKDWVDAGNQRYATYTNLDPGEYVFRATASNKDGVWNETGILITIIITPPWWKTTWAYIFYALILGSILYFTWKLQVKRIKVKHEYEMSRFEAEKLHEVDELKSKFFTNISHEFRTPLTLIQGPAKQIIENTNESPTKDSANFIYRNSLKLISLVNQLLDLSKLEAGEMTIRAVQTDVIAFIKEIVLSFTPLADRKKITLKVNHDEEQILAYLDKDKIYKIINNILSNAFKFTAEGGRIEVNVTLPTPSVPLPRGDKTLFKVPSIGGDAGVGQKRLTHSEYVEISIRDTGIGIHKEKIDKIFDRFYQVDGSHTREQEGTGIGLALTKELVELHKGKIDVESKEGEGSTFTISLPLGKDHLKPEQIVEIDQSEDHILSLQEDDPTLYSSYQNKFDTESLTHPQKPTLLVVEDNPDVRSFTRGIFENEYEIYEASNGEEGMNISFEKIPDLIISDLMMPKMDGFEMCNKLKTDERTSHIPIIMLTAKATNKDKIDGYETGADDYITKPFDSEVLRARVKNLVEQRKKLKEHFIKDGLFNLDDKNITQVDKVFLQKVVQVINNHISDASFGVDTFASDIALSRVTLHKKLVSLIGEPPSELIKRIRLSKAAKLLQSKHENISEIALDVGFNNPAYFSECFRKQFGVSPSQYQQKFTIH